MKLIHRPLFILSITTLCIGLAGCASKPMVEPLGNGYARLAHPTRASRDQPETMRVSLEYKKLDGKPILVWPSLYGVDEVVKGDLVIFVGDRAYVHPLTDEPKGTQPRLFADRAPGLPLDITDELLWRWSKTSGKDFTQAAQLLSLASPSENNGQLQVHLIFASDDWPDTLVQLDWNQVSDIIREVREKGTVYRDLRWHTPYIAK